MTLKGEETLEGIGFSETVEVPETVELTDTKTTEKLHQIQRKTDKETID